MQNHTSRNTSVNSKRLPAIFRKIAWQPLMSVLDYGCGKHPQLAESFFKKYYPHIRYTPYDPYQQIGGKEEAQIALLSNVINVIDDEQTICEVIKDCLRLCPAVAITVYEGDKSGIGRVTRRDCWQWNRTVKDWYDFLIANNFNVIQPQSKLLVVKRTK